MPLSSPRVRVLTPAVQLGVLDYKPPASGPLPVPGSFVEVPLGPRKVLGVVWDEDGLASKPVPEDKLKAIAAVLDVPPLPIETLRFTEWVARYYLAAPGSVLKMAMSVREALEAPATHVVYAASKASLEKTSVRLTPQRLKVLDSLPPGRWMTAQAIAKAAGVSASVVKGLAKSGALAQRVEAADQAYPQFDPKALNLTLSSEQQQAADQLWARRHIGKPLVLDGVTGSGKTEVYFDVLSRQLAETEGQAVVLVPEIALTSAWLDRFTERFGAPPVLWHSSVGQAERRRAWRAILGGEARVVVGARSALFLPFRDLSMIIVDEEHDPAFKQEDGINYNARDMAIVRGDISQAPVILASATPSLETHTNADSGRFERVSLTQRHGAAQMPSIELIDLRVDTLASAQWLSSKMRSAITHTISRGEQALIFLNRRGYAPVTICRVCGERIACPQCSAWLVEHRFHNRLQCHHCGFALPKPQACPECETSDSLVPCGPGIERLAEEVNETFPEARVLQLSSDSITSPRQLAQLIASVSEGAVDIIVGTQLVSKGHHFPNLTFVGVPDADMGLGGGDLRAAERTYQQMTQVAGRAGRADRPGRVMLQSYMPDHPVMQALKSGDRAAFLAEESAARKRRALPPFGRMAGIVLSGKDEARVHAHARSVALQAPQMPGVSVLGPAPAPLALLRGRHRVRLLLMAERSVFVPQVMREWLSRVEPDRAVRVSVDIDPYSFL